MKNIFFELKAPVVVDFELTYNCNLNCEFCYVSNDKLNRENIKEPSINKRKRIIDKIANLEINHVVFTGGEPLLSPQLLDLVNYTVKKGVNASINTNATLVSKSFAKALKKLNVGVLITLQGATPQEHDSQAKSSGSWERTLTGLKCLNEEEVEVSINMTVTRKNFRLIKEVAKFVEIFNTKNAFFNTKFTFSRFVSSSKKQYEELGLTQPNLKELSTIIHSTELSTLKNVKSLTPIPACSEISSKISSSVCRAGSTRCCITPDLCVKACPFSDKIIGNLENNTLEESWFSEEMKKWRSRGNYPDECLNCAAFGNCGGGCRVIAQAYPNNCDPLMISGREMKEGTLKPISWKGTQIKDNYQYAPTKGVRFRKEDFGGVLMSRIGKEIIMDSKSSIFVWKQIEKGIKVKDIIKNVEEIFKVDTKTAEKDVKTFLSILQSKGWII